VGEYELILSDFDAHAGLTELIGDVFGILNELPNPPNLGALDFCEVVEVLGEFLRKLLEASFVLGLLVLPDGLVARLHE
jgi:hypothetical protein